MQLHHFWAHLCSQGMYVFEIFHSTFQFLIWNILRVPKVWMHGLLAKSPWSHQGTFALRCLFWNVEMIHGNKNWLLLNLFLHFNIFYDSEDELIAMSIDVGFNYIQSSYSSRTQLNLTAASHLLLCIQPQIQQPKTHYVLLKLGSVSEHFLPWMSQFFIYLFIYLFSH